MSKAKSVTEIKRWTETLWDKHFGEADRVEGWHTEEEKAAIAEASTARKLWTAVDCDGVLHLTNGYHYVNRIYYVIAENPCPEGLEIDIKLD
jgi:hypothetical protein